MQALRAGHTLLVDNKNLTAKLRRTWLQAAHQHGKQSSHINGGSVCVYLETELAECKYRVHHRTSHPTLSGPGGAAVVDREAKRFEPPLVTEGTPCSHVLNIRCL